MYDDCEYLSDNSPVLLFARKNEAGLLALFARNTLDGEEKLLNLAFEQRLQVRLASFVLLSIYAEVDVVGVSAARNAQFMGLADT